MQNVMNKWAMVDYLVLLHDQDTTSVLKRKIKVLVIGGYRVMHTSRPEAEIIIDLAAAGLDMTVMTHGNTEYARRFEECGVRLIPFYPEKKFRRAESQRIRKELINGNYDILQLYNSKAIINGIRAARGVPVKVVVYRGYTGHIHWYDPTAYLKYLHPRVDKIICNSIGLEQYFRQQPFLDKSKLVTINKGHDLEWYRDVVPVDLRTLDIPDDAFVVSCMANVRPMKGIPYLLQAMNFIPPDLPIHLVLGGNSTDTSAFRRIAAASPNADKIHLLGYREDALGIVAASDVFVLASIKGESITRAVQEAMALGIAPVITDIPGNTELVNDGANGLVVPRKNAKALADAILRIYHDPELKRKFSEGARHHMATVLSHKNTVDQMKVLYEELASS